MAYSNNDVSLCQCKYYLNLMKDSCLMGCKPSSTLIDDSLHLNQYSSEPLVDIFLIYMINRLPHLFN